MSLRAKNTNERPGTAAPHDPEVLGYIFAETARIRCEQLIESGDRRAWLAAVHRDLGLAAYHLSTSFSPEWREQCLAAARDASDLAGGLAGAGRTSHGDGPQPIRAADRRRVLRRIFEEAVAAGEVSGDAVAESSAPYLRKAHVHALAAAASLDRRLADAGTKPAHAG